MFYTYFKKKYYILTSVSQKREYIIIQNKINYKIEILYLYVLLNYRIKC